MKKEKKFKLKNVTFIKTEYGYRASGYAIGNPKFFTGQFIYTSAIKKITEKPPTIYTQNSIYSIAKKDLPKGNLELWSLLYGTELPKQEPNDALHKRKPKRQIRQNTKRVQRKNPRNRRGTKLHNK